MNDCKTSCSTRTQSWRHNQSKSIFSERDTVEMERIHIPHGQLFQLEIDPRERSMERRMKFEKHEISLFLLISESAKSDIKTADDQLDRTSSWTNNGTAQVQIIVVFVISIYDELQTQILYFITVTVAQLFFTTTCRQAHWTRWSLSTEATLDDRLDLLVSGQSEVFYQLNERETNVFLISNKINQVLKFPNKLTMISDLVKNYPQKNAEEVDY